MLQNEEDDDLIVAYGSAETMDNVLPSFVQAQTSALERFQRARHQHDQQPPLCDDEAAALAAALVASERDEELRRERENETRRRRKEEEEVRRKRRREELERQGEELAKQLHQQEQSQADQELAQALEVSAEEAHSQQIQKKLDDSLTEAQQKRQKERNAGSWDCLHCTYENPPYSPCCGMCQSKAPPGVLVFESIPNLRFGLELELIITNGIRDGYTLEWMAKELTKLGPPIVEYRGYTHNISTNWKIVTDSSLRGRNTHDLCLELVSPVLQGNEGLDQLRVILEHTRQLGIATNRTCGFHVHVDATTTPVHALKRISQCFVALENAFDMLVAGNHHHPSRRHRSADQNMFCRSNRIEFGRLSNRQRWDKIDSVQTKEELVNLMNPQNDRYRKLNLTNLVNPNRPSTIEFRLHGGVQELREAEAWVRLVLRFAHRAAPTTGGIITDGSVVSTIQSLPEEATPAMELEALWKVIACPGLEQFYVLGKKLFVPPQQLRNEWRCKQCRKPFGTSRALSQHVEATGHRMR